MSSRKLSDILATAGTAADEKLEEVWSDHFPLLRDGMYPLPGKASGTWATPRFSITLFGEGHRLKAVFGSKTHPKKFWCTLDGPEGVLEQIESLLAAGKGEWREAKYED